jgi:orotate phosphoribosyltransferase
MDHNAESALKVAEFLLRIKAVELKPDTPFTWASGLKSPIYCDNRKTLSYPAVRTFLRQQFVETIEKHFGKPDVIAGVATGGIAIGALVAQEMGVPFIYVRSEAKKHGLGNQVEGVLEKGQTVVVIEDLISTGKSSLAAIAALREAGASVKGMVAIFTYGFQIAEDQFETNQCKVHALSNYDFLLQQALKENYISAAQHEVLSTWKADPSAWSAQFSVV